jgi:tRNA A-37 threonylcarbamoyl transferase component Bud32
MASVEEKVEDHYKRLLDAGIPIPKMLDIDMENERILKEYIPGPTIFDLVKQEEMKPEYFHQVRHMAYLAQQADLNIDYFPTNFVVWEDVLWYIDYECNPYSERWNFENWGNDYWWKSPAFLDYVNRSK